MLLGAALVIAAGAGLVAVSTELLDAIEVTPETYRIAAGTVAALVGMRVVVFPGRAEEPQLNGMWASVVPVAFPLLLTPELIAFDIDIRRYGIGDPLDWRPARSDRRRGGIGLGSASSAPTVAGGGTPARRLPRARRFCARSRGNSRRLNDVVGLRPGPTLITSAWRLL